MVSTSSEGFRSAQQPGVKQLESVLTITDLKEQDQGAYSCYAQSADSIPAVLPYELIIVKRKSVKILYFIISPSIWSLLAVSQLHHQTTVMIIPVRMEEHVRVIQMAFFAVVHHALLERNAK